MLSRALLACFILIATGLTGCNPAGKLVGKWEADLSGIQTEVAEADIPLASLASSWMSSLKLQSEFSANGTCSFTGSFFGNAKTTNCKWRYVKSEGDTLVLMVAMEQGDKEGVLRVKFIDYDTFEMTPPIEAAAQAGQTLVYKRLKT
jgi:hypothetical protein